jgi:hypothetical protein
VRSRALHSGSSALNAGSVPNRAVPGLMCGRADLDCLVEIQTVVEATLMTDKSGAETAPDRRSEALWPILVAVLAAIALTLLRPQEVRVGPFGISSPR